MSLIPSSISFDRLYTFFLSTLRGYFVNSESEYDSESESVSKSDVYFLDDLSTCFNIFLLVRTSPDSS